MKKDEVAAEKAQRKMKKKMNKQRHSVPSEMALEFNRYIILATSLDYTNEQIWKSLFKETLESKRHRTYSLARLFAVM